MNTTPEEMEPQQEAIEPAVEPKKRRNLTPVKEIHEALREAYDPMYYASIYRQMRYAFGEKWDEDDGGSSKAGGDFPDFPAIRVKSLAIGQSRRILTTSFVDLARNMYSPGEPEFPQVDKYTAEVRKQFWLRRSDQGDWDTARASAFLEGNGLGVGFLQVGFQTNPESGQPRTTARHSPTCYTLWDPHEASAGRASYICFVQHLPLNRAIALYGKKMEDFVENVDCGGGHRMRTVRIFEYYDLGLGRWDATRCVIPQSMTNEPILREASHWPTMLPFAFYEHLLPPGMRRPIGRIPLQMPTQEALNELEAMMRSVSQTRPVDIWDSTFVDPNDFAKVQKGITNQVRTLKPVQPGQLPMLRIPAEEISTSAINLLQYLQVQFNEDSGTNEYDRGGKPQGQITATESNRIEQNSARQGGWSDKQTMKFAVRTVEAVNYAASIGDTDPVEIDLFGVNVTINDPSNPNLDIAAFMEEPSAVLISEDSLRYIDQQRVGDMRLNQLSQIRALGLLGQTVNPTWFTEQVLKAIGEKDANAAMMTPPPIGPDGKPLATGTAAPPAAGAAPDATQQLSAA